MERNILIKIGKLKQKFALLTNNDLLFVEGGKDIIDGQVTSLENIQEINKEILVGTKNK